MELVMYDDGDESDSRYALWLEPEGGRYMGLCVGCGPTAAAAQDDARLALSAAYEKTLRHEYEVTTA